jgi:hypothetical protein
MLRTADKHGVDRGALHVNVPSIVLSSSQCSCALPATSRTNFLVVEGTGSGRFLV